MSRREEDVFENKHFESSVRWGVCQVAEHPLRAGAAAAAVGAARGCGAVRMLPARRRENTPKEPLSGRCVKTLETIFQYIMCILRGSSLTP